VIEVREPKPSECNTITGLCLRSKAHWGYDAEFMESCREELTVTYAALRTNHCRVAAYGRTIEGYVEVSFKGKTAELEKLFVCPNVMGRSIGKMLMQSALEHAAAQGASSIIIAADPGAVPFYEKLGAIRIGSIESNSIAGRSLPLLRLSLH